MTDITVKNFTAASLLAVACATPLDTAYAQTMSPTNTDETFLLNLKNADIASLIETVSLRTGKNFIVDPRVKATVNVISSEPITAEKLYEIFLSILEVHGYAAVQAGAVVKIVPSELGTQRAVPVLSERIETGDKLITQVVYLERMSALEMVEALRPLLPATASIGAEGNANAIIVTERADNINKLIKLIDSIDGG